MSPSRALPIWETTLLTALFAVWVLSPALAGLAGVEGPDAKLQNRSLAELPVPTLHNLGNARFGIRFEKWLEDHLPLRTQWLELDHLVDYHVFSDSPVPDTAVLGTDGFVWARERIIGPRCKVAPSAAALIEVFERFDRVAQDEGLDLLIVVSPNKATMYPEHIPDGYAEWYADEVLGEVAELEAYAARPSSPLLNIWPVLRAERARLEAHIADPRLRTLFRRTDRHWNVETGQLQGKAIIDALDGVDWNQQLAPVVGDTYIEAESELSSVYLKLGLPEPYTTLTLPDTVRLGTRRRSLPDGPTSLHTHRQGATPAPAPLSVVVVRDSFLNYSYSEPKAAQGGGVYAIASQVERSVFVHRLSVAKADPGVMEFVEHVDAIVLQGVQGNSEQFVRHADTYVDFIRAVGERSREAAEARHPTQK